MTAKYYAEFMHPGIIVTETSYEEISEEEYKNPKRIRVGKSSFGFRVMTREESVINGELLKGEFKNKSGWFIKGEMISKDGVAKLKGKDSTLYRNMENNDIPFVVHTTFGQYIPMSTADTLLE